TVAGRCAANAQLMRPFWLLRDELQHSARVVGEARRRQRIEPVKTVAVEQGGKLRRRRLLAQRLLHLPDEAVASCSRCEGHRPAHGLPDLAVTCVASKA